MTNPFAISSAAVGRNKKVISFVDLSLIADGQGNGSIFELSSGDLLPLFSLNREVLDIAMPPRANELYVLTHEKVLHYPAITRETEPEEVLSGDDIGLFKKFCLSGSSIYVVTMSDELLRLDLKSGGWKEISCELDETDGIECLCAQDGRLKFIAGFNGMIMSVGGTRCDGLLTPTNKILASVTEKPDGSLVAGGQNGILLRGAPDALDIIGHDWEGYDIWDIDIYGDRTFLLLENGVFELTQENEVVPVIGRDQVRSIFFAFKRHQEVLWAVGERHILQFDGTEWSEAFSFRA